MKKLLLLFWITSTFCQAQDKQKIDSLNALLSIDNHDTTQINLLNQLASQYYFTDAEKARQYGREIIQIAYKANYEKGLWKGNNVLGYAYFCEFKNDSAIHYFNTALQQTQTNDTRQEEYYANYWLGISHISAAEYDTGRKYVQKSITLAELTRNGKDLAQAYKGLGDSYYMQNNWETALQNYHTSDSLFGDTASPIFGDLLQNMAILYSVLKNKESEVYYLEKSLAIYKKINDKFGINGIFVRLGIYEREYGSYDKAEEYFIKALDYFVTIDDEYTIGEIEQYIASLALRREQYQKALKYYELAIPKLQKADYQIALMNSYLEMGQLKLKMGSYSEALSYFDKAIPLSEKIGDKQTRLNLLKSLSEYYGKIKDFKKAYQNQIDYIALNDSLMQETFSKDLIEMEAKYQNEKRQREIELLEARNQLKEQKVQKQKLIFLLAGTGILFMAGLFFFLYKGKQRANKKLKQLDEMKSRFFSNISHEFRTPLTLISGPIERRLAAKKIDQEDKEELGMIQRNAAHLLTLINQLLELSKLESGGMKLQIREGNLGTELKQTADAFNGTASEKSIDYRLAITDMPNTYFDADIFQKITINLLSNAFKYVNRNGMVKIQANYSEKNAEIKVSNSGTKIKQEDQERIFDRFYQIEGTIGGTGIGLALVKELVTLSRGSIEAVSSDQMTIFTVKLPITKKAFRKEEITSIERKAQHTDVIYGDNADTLIEENVESDPDKELPIVLVVEDNTDIRKFVKRNLKNEYRVIEAEDGKTGIDNAIKYIPDIIISDIMMPETDGIKLTNTLKQDERTSHIPIILLTAKGGNKNEIKGLKTGADHYITKPFNIEVLQTKIGNLIRLRNKLHKKYSKEVILMPSKISIDSHQEKFLSKLQYIIDTKLSDSEFNSKEFCKIVGMSRMQLHRKMKALTGESPHEYIRKARLTKAGELLQHSDSMVSEVGYAVGFNDPSFFAKSFKDFFGCTPKEFVSKAISS